MHTRPIQDRIDWLLDLSRIHSKRFCDPENHLARQRYQAEHSTEIVALKCMDGRIHLPYATQTPMGIIRPFRNLGGIFDLGWPYLGDLLADLVGETVSQGRRVLVIITYHFSKGDSARGCAGFDCDQAAALAHAQQIKQQVETIFGAGHQTVYPLVCGFETDEDALTLHHENGVYLDLSTLVNQAREQVKSDIESVFSDMPDQIRHDLMPLVEGNLRHIVEIRKSRRELAVEHREWILCVGRGFDFLHVPNIALIIGPYSPDLSHPIQKAAAIIQSNMDKGRVPDDGFLLLCSAPYQEPGPDRARAEMKARFMAAFTARVIDECQPLLAKKMIRQTAILNWPTRRLEIFD
ncbi:carboxysome shell carbonic anhydrase domain-containg protein [Saccharospirillum impatiens]|uniref:carboxysome shell carbonic anhydrase domain-containg protein n=1 Tax=Saccharospirillum impatiens TaxID=169438 RepID=UPI0003F80A48|nr:carboxysome shell carbonic anhydrase domain-containg protein [Saccharospirillum impatiens]